MSKPTLLALAAALAIGQPAQAEARTILITNDDGLTSNVVALYRALKSDGHDVIVSVPCTNQSGMGAAIEIARPLAPLDEACVGDAAGIGAPGAGPVTRKGLGDDFYYVDSTPVVALYHGLDVVAQQRWGAAPDLVLSGPNEGQNVGSIILSSGTVSAAQVAALYGLSAIALSAGANTEDEGLAHPLSTVVGELAADLVEALDARSDGGRLLPEGLALNVNFPDDPTGAAWQLTEIGTYQAYQAGFAADMAADASPVLAAMAAARGMKLPNLPGLVFGFNDAEPTAEQLDDEAFVYRSDIAVSPMQAGYGVESPSKEWLDWLLEDLISE